MNDIEFFKKYIQFHSPNLISHYDENYYEFCPSECTKCKIIKVCSAYNKFDFVKPVIKKQYIRKNFPEYEI